MRQINGDNPGSIKNRLLYFYQCLNNHRKGNNKECEILNPTLSMANLDTFGKTPSRLLCDALWNTIDYKNIKFEFKFF